MTRVTTRRPLSAQRVLRLGGLSVRLAPRGLAAGIGLLAAGTVIALLAIGTGDFPIPPSGVVAALLGRGTPAEEFIVGTLRAPRVVTGLLVGAAFGLSGALFQSITRNPLGSPDFLGLAAGAATGGILASVSGGTPWQVAMAALAGCAAAAALVHLLAYRHGGTGYRLVGIGVAAILTAVDSYLLTRADLYDAATAAAWLTGSLSGRTWAHAALVAAALAVLAPVCAAVSRPLRLMEMGDDAAGAMGVRVERVRLAAVAAAVGLCGAATAAAGPVAFLALCAPQLARRLTGSPGVTLTASALMGAVLLVAADLAAQRLLAPVQFPVGVMTALLGGAYLVFMLRRERR